MEVVMGSNATAQIVPHPRLQPSAPAACQDAGSVPVFWIYIDDKGRWCLRKEGGAAEAVFSSRDAAIAFVRDLAGGLPFRLFIEAQDGKVAQEHHAAHMLSPGEPMQRASGGARPAIPEKPTTEAGATEVSELSRGLEWARQLEASARISPSRIGLLAELFHRSRR
jgi:hypothetical protein